MILSLRYLCLCPPYFFANYAIRNISFFRGAIFRTPLTCDSLNPNVKKVEYAVRGPIPTRALQIESELISHPESFPFDKLIYVNIGDPQNLGQCPITFPRQLLALCAYPALISYDNANLFPCDVKQRAREILDSAGSFGGYSHSLGFPFVRKSIANFILNRDHVDSDSTIILSDGASKIINVLLSCLSTNTMSVSTGVMIPIPQYPLYTASLSYLGLFPIPYYLNEDSSWELHIDDLYYSLKKHTDICLPRAFVVINPGNPTGQCFDSDQQLKILKFCCDNNLLLLADEVYQDNIYDENVKWTSFRKILLENKDQLPGLQLVSFHSLSKGYMGECGFRGGYAELIGFDESTIYQITKFLSSMLCPNIAGQLLFESYVNPPIIGDPSFQQFFIEKSRILRSLSIRADKLYKCMKNIPNISINPVQGAMYAFPRIILPKNAVCASLNHPDPILRIPDVYYCMKLLEETGIVTVPGSGFGQVDGTWHFRTTILPHEDIFDQYLSRFREFHLRFLQAYS